MALYNYCLYNLQGGETERGKKGEVLWTLHSPLMVVTTVEIVLCPWRL